MKKPLLLLLTVLFCVVSFHAQDDDEVLKIESSLVLVPVTVTDAGGKFVPGLTREDFRLYDEGKQQDIAHFDATDAPFTVVIVLDVSDSAKFKLTEIQDAAIAFVGKLRPQDRVALYTFDAYVTKVLDATADRESISKAIKSTRTGGGTSLYSAVYQVTTKYLPEIKTRKAIVLFTDGIDTSSRFDDSYRSTLGLAQQSDALIFTIQYNTTEKSDPSQQVDASSQKGSEKMVRVTPRGVPVKDAYKTGTQYMKQLAVQTGGKYQLADTLRNLSDAFAKIADELKEQYSLGFYAADRTPGETQRDIRVQISNRNNVNIRARRGYTLKPTIK